ncbi:ABC transporter permease [Tenuibacillus multivorans]|nr:ABC transporter permease [Tenuibacillus multivorans]GEL77780.1 ABC transporter permease [Tenuibacillus multivorans]
MMTGKRLFKRRLKQHIQFYMQIRRVAVDWAVWIYVLIPLLLTGLYQYITLWNMEAGWATYLNEPALALIITIFIFSGISISFLQSADILYLWQKQDVMGTLHRYRLGYYYTISLVKWLIVIGILAPIFMVYLNWTGSMLCALGLIVYFLQVLVGILRRRFKIQLGKWVSRFLIIGLVVVVYILMRYSLAHMATTGWVLALVTIVMTAYYSTYFIRQKQNFYREIDLDTEHKNKLLQLVLMQSAYIGGPEYLSEKISNLRKHPWLFRKSQKMFKAYTPEIGYREVFIKSLLRSKNWLLLYVQIVGFGVFGIVMFPFWLKWFMWIGMIFLIGNFLKTYWNKIWSHQFLDLVKWREVEPQKVSRHTFRIAIIPASLVLSAVLGYIILSYWGILFLPMIGLAIAFGVVEFFTKRIS